MALETGTYIDSLDVSNPAATDALSQADEHLRLLKSTIKATWVNVTGPVTATHTELNTRPAMTTDGSTPALASGIDAAAVRTLIGVSAPAAIESDGTVPTLATGISAGEIISLIGAATLLTVYPVGAIFTSVAATAPATMFGGTWEALPAGRVLVNFDASDTDFDTVEFGGGNKSGTVDTVIPRDGWGDVQSNTDELPEPTTAGRLITGSGTGEDQENLESLAHASGDQTITSSVASLLQPYMVVYMWKRTA
jgi:hypothetical protein